MQCPKCAGKMVDVRFQDVEVEWCEKCHGIFFDAGEQEKVRKSAEAIDVASAASGRVWNSVVDISCPKCGVKMTKLSDVDQDHIWYEKCPSCKGMFFDAGEFRDFARYTIVDYLKGLLGKEKER